MLISSLGQHTGRSSSEKILSLTIQSKKLSIVLPTHSSRVQFLISTASPGHSAPPKAGAGLSQTLLNDSLPWPQVTEQGTSSSKSDQPPSTANKVTVKHVRKSKII